MPSLQTDFPPLRKTTEITKALRSREAPLLSVLATARGLHAGSGTRGDGGVFFPRRDEWLLEWLTQRLREDDGEPGRRARCARECWEFLGELLRAVEPAVVAGTLKRHGVVALVAKTVEEAAAGVSDDGERTARLLDAMFGVIALLRRLGQDEGSVAASMKSTPDVCAGILGGFLDICRMPGMRVEREWVDAAVGLWRGSIWGSANSKKTSAIWSERCLHVSATLLAAPDVDPFLRSELESMLAEYVFSTEILFPVTLSGQKQTAAAKPSSKDLIPLLAPLKQEDTDMTGATAEGPASARFLPPLFRIAIKAFSTKRRGASADTAVVEVLFTSLLSVVPGLDLETESASPPFGGDIIASLLSVLIETKTALSSGSLSRIITNFARLGSADRNLVRWSLVETALAIDFDTFLHPSAGKLSAEMFSALLGAPPSENVIRVVRLVVDGFVKARDVMGFVARWREQLESETEEEEEDIWRSDALAGLFAEIVEDSLTSAQVAKLVKELKRDKSWVVLDAVLRGLRREETETRLLGEGILESVAKAARKDDCEWRAWRVLVRLGDFQPEFMLPAVEDAFRIVKSDDNRWKEAVFAAEVLLQVAERTDDEQALEGAQTLLRIAVDSLGTGEAWDGKVGSINIKNFGVAVALAIVGGHIGVLEKVEANVRNRFVDALVRASVAAEGLEAAKRLQYMGEASTTVAAADEPSKLVRADDVCKALMGCPEFYEHTALKDAMVAALTMSLSPFAAATEDVPSALANPPSIEKSAEAKYKFTISCLQQFPLEALRRPAREKILDVCLLLDVAGFSFVRPLMRKLWRVGNAGSFLAANCEAVKEWFSHTGAADIFRRLLGHTFANRESNKVKEYLHDLLAMASELIRDSEPEGLTAGQQEMNWVIVTEFWKSRREEFLGTGAVEKMRNKVLKQWMRSLGAGVQVNPIALKYWREVWELERDDTQNASKLACKVAQRVTQTAGDRDDETLLESLGAVCAVAQDLDDAINATAFAVAVAGWLRDEPQMEVTHHYRSMAERLDMQTHRDLIGRVVDACFSDVGDGTWGELLKVLVNSIKKPDSPEELAISIDVFSAVHTRLILELPSSQTPAAFLAAVECIDILLREKSWTVIQHSLDTTISSLTIACSSLGPSLTPRDADAFYTIIISVISSILAVHRHRIRGRYHLVVALLNQLLTCLFTPRLSRRKTEAALHPPWLQPPTNNSPLSPRAARAFGRVLQAFCDPPVSTVRTYRSELIESERGKERKMVSATVGPVLECFVKRVLEEKMDVEVRKEVGVGMDKVLEVLGREGMGRVTGRMTAEGRAVVRGLWAEFARNRGERV